LTTPVPAKPPQHRLLRVAVQLVGVVVGIASLAWCVLLALKPENKEQFARLSDASAGAVAAMVGLTLATLLLNGLLFWIALTPVRRLRIPDVLATNCVCTFLAYLPLKLGGLTRILIHNRRDRVPLILIGSWFLSVAAVMFASFTPPILGVLWLGSVDTMWIAVVVLGEVLMVAAIVLAAGFFRGDRGQERIERLATTLRLRPLRALIRSKLWSDMHAGFDMLASPGAVGGAATLRILDVGVQSARLIVAAGIFGLALPIQQAIPLALVYYLVGAMSPAGLAGLREGAATGLVGPLLAAAGIASSGDARTQFAPVFLLVLGTEAMVYLAAAAVGIGWLRPDRLLKLRRQAAIIAAAADPATASPPDHPPA